MKTRTIFAALAVPAAALGLFAQETVTITGGPKGNGNGVTLGVSGDPGYFRIFTNQTIFSANGTPVTGLPYSADEKTESVQTLADGTHITNTTTTRVYRDSQGRTRTEMTLPGFEGDKQRPHVTITISDPVAQKNYMLDPESKTVHSMPRMTFDRVRAAEKMQIPDIAPGTPGPGTVVFRESRVPPAKHEDLGDNVIEGVSAKGSQDTNTIETGAMGNDRPITITSERWFSPDLQIEVKSVRSDPRMGTTTHTVTNISRTEPDASLFQVPSDYKVDEPKTVGPNFHYEYHQ